MSSFFAKLCLGFLSLEILFHCDMVGIEWLCRLPYIQYTVKDLAQILLNKCYLYQIVWYRFTVSVSLLFLR